MSLPINDLPDRVSKVLRFLKTAEDHKQFEVVAIKKILVPNLLIYIYLHCVRSFS